MNTLLAIVEILDSFILDENIKRVNTFLVLHEKGFSSSSESSRSWVEGTLHDEAVEDEVDLVNGDEAILNRVVELEGVEKLGGSVVSGTSSLWGVSTSHQWKQWLLSSLARFHTNNNAKRSVSVSGLFGFYMDAKKVQRVKWKREEKWYGEYGVHVDFFFFFQVHMSF